MGGWLLDTNVLLRVQDEEPGFSEEAAGVVTHLLEYDAVYVTPQVLVEFWCTATRPTDMNGLGWDTQATAARVKSLKNRFELLDDSPEVFTHWLALVEAYQRKGKQVHDTRLVAVMRAHGVKNLLTFNVGDFKAYSEIKAVHPRDVA